MGAGSDNASGAAGLDLITVVQASARNLPVALRYDGASKDYRLDPNSSGQYLSVHPVDQRVALALLIKYGTIKSVPALGSRFHLIALDERAEAAARDEVQRVLGAEIKAGNIKVLSISIERRMNPTGLLFVRVQYQNLRASDRNAIKNASNAPTLLPQAP